MTQATDIPITERLHRVSRATILVRHALTDLCADYLRTVAIIHAGELTDEQEEAITDVANFLSDEADAVQYAIRHLDSFFEGERVYLPPDTQKPSRTPTSQ